MTSRYRLSAGILSLFFLLTCAGPAQKAAPPSVPPPEPAVILFDNLGTHSHPITTRAAMAQQYFDQGLRLVYAFNHEEAVRAFAEAARLDSTCAMAYWGWALVLGPNINMPMEKPAEQQACKLVQQAMALRGQAAEAERAYIEALATRYAPEEGANRAALDSAYAAAMGQVAGRYPDDLDASTIYAEARMDLRPWDYWTQEGSPQPGTLEILQILEGVLARNPDHPGALHYYIHIVEASSEPQRAVPAAERLGGLMPGAGHLVHMPSHIYIRVGRYAEAWESNAKAAAADEAYMAKYQPVEGYPMQGMYPLMYYTHNLHFQWASACMEGWSAEAMRAARAAVANVPMEVVRQVPFVEFVVPTPLYALARFGRWEELLQEPAPPADLRFSIGVWHYARGLALAATGRMDEATAALDSVGAIAAATPPEQAVALNSAAVLLRVAEAVLGGELAARKGQFDEAVRLLTEGVRLEDGLRYDEPPDWYFPVRQSLGAVLLTAGRAAEAETIYREDLQRNPENGWSLYGLRQSLQAQGRKEEAAAVAARFDRAWAKADVQLTASRF